LGNVYHVERLLNALDVFVLNSNFEGMSNTVIEAMACGIPVIATRVGSNPQSVDHEVTGLLIEANDTTGLVQAMLRMSVSAETRRRYANAARQRVERTFSLEVMVRRYETLYGQCDFPSSADVYGELSARVGS
jgi:glycosyltransferase involved in cell wall biosynthesis